MSRFFVLSLNGLTQGAIYAAMALALVMIWRATQVINFAQGAMAMFTTYLALFAIDHGVPYWLAFLVALSSGLILGAIVERVIVRPVESAPPLNVGIRVGRMLTLGWSLASLVGALAGVLIAPSLLLYPTFMDQVLVFGFTGAVLGGLDSAVGAVVGGLLMGFALSYVGGYLGSDLETVGALVILIAVLMVRPRGLFSRHRLRQA